VRALLMTVALGLAPCVVLAQSQLASIAGTVRDTTGHSLAGVQVWIVGTSHMVLTDTLGRYELDSVVAGPVRLRTGILGYVSTQLDTVLIAGQRATLDWRVVPSWFPDGGNTVRTVPLRKADSQ
jgi:hypothetical protein